MAKEKKGSDGMKMKPSNTYKGNNDSYYCIKSGLPAEYCLCGADHSEKEEEGGDRND